MKPPKSKSDRLNFRIAIPTAPANIHIAAFCCWQLGIFLTLLCLAGARFLGTAEIVRTLSSVGAVYCLAGFALPRRLWKVGWWLSGLCAIWSLLLMKWGWNLPICQLGLVYNLGLELLILSAWQWLERK